MERLPDLHGTSCLVVPTHSCGQSFDPWRKVATGEAVPYLAKRFPFEAPAWKEWQAAARPDYSGKWMVVGHDPAKGGDYTGVLTVTSSGETNHYRGKFTHEFEDGSSVTGSTEAVLYAKFEWRGRAKVGDRQEAEIFFGNENGTRMHGRRLLTPVGDLGMDETLYKAGSAATLLTAIPK